MNYLAHSHLAYITHTSYTGAILGDFVKGSISALPYSSYIKQGVYIHRKVDSFTDHHDITKKWKLQLGPWRRYGGIILDMFFDHALAKQFDDHKLQLKPFSQLVYKELLTSLKQDSSDLPARFTRTVNYMSEGDWLTSYQKVEHIQRALSGIDSRLSKPVGLANSVDWYLTHQAEFDLDFIEFYQELQSYGVSLSNAAWDE